MSYYIIKTKETSYRRFELRHHIACTTWFFTNGTINSNDETIYKVRKELNCFIVDIFSTDGAFAALSDSGLVFTWGYKKFRW